jgi:hypothetical protein
MGFDLDDTPRHWVADAAVPTALGNTLHLIFPMGERFFVRAVKHFADQLEDPKLRAQVKGFYAQEGRHAHEHERVFALLERHGYDVKPFLKFYKKIAFETIERVSPPKLRLAVTVALEHYTAIMAEDALEHGLLDRAHASMRPLLAWHAAEEIEHKAVAFDVLKSVDDSYALADGRDGAGDGAADGLLGAGHDDAAAPGEARAARGVASAEGGAQGQPDHEPRVRAGHPRVPAPRLSPVGQRQPRGGAADARGARPQRGVTAAA